MEKISLGRLEGKPLIEQMMAEIRKAKRELIEEMRDGKKIKCPKCEKGFIAAVGDCKITNVFQCDECETKMEL